jgi:hypothetical protein
MNRNKRRTRPTLVPILILAGLGLVACAHAVNDVPSVSGNVYKSAGNTAR